MNVGIPEQQHEAVGPSQQLWEHFVVVGLPGTGLQTVQGELGFLGSEHKYKPAFVDSLPTSSFDENCRLPPQLPTCCLPAGVDIVLYQDLDKADLTPHTFTCVLTEGDGNKVYATCLTFYDRVPSDLCAKHEDLLGAVALKAMCLLSRRPYLTSAKQVLHEVYRCAFQHGSSIPVPDLINSLLAVPCPQQGSPKLCLRLCSSQCMVCPPLPIGPPPGEVSLQPLLEVMQPGSLVGLFAAVLLEQRVLLRSRHHWLLTVAAESVVRLLYPLKYQHVYIPVMPSSLADYLEAPTPFLMGLHSAEPVDHRLLEMLVVADLDKGTLHLGKDDGLMQHCLSHPYMQRLERRIRMLMQPSVTEADVVSSSTEQEDPWVAAARALGPGAPWSPSKQALLLRVFMEFFHDVLRDHQLFLSTSSAEGDCRSGLPLRDSRMTSGGGSSLNGSGAGAAASGVRALRGALSLSGAAGATGSLQQGRSSSLAAGAGALLQAQCKVGMQALLDHHCSICRHQDPALLQQIMQGIPFLCFVAEHNSMQNPLSWLEAGESALGAWRAAEEEVWMAQQAAAKAVQATGLTCGQEVLQEAADHTPAGSTEAAGQHGLWQDVCPGAPCTLICIPDQLPSPLMPPRGYMHKSFPRLILSEYSERSQGLKRRKTSANRQKRPSVGRRRAISELMGSPLDMRRKSPLPAGTNTDTSPPRLIRANPLDMPANNSATVQGPLPPLAPGLPMPSLAKISNVSNASVNTSLSEEYSAEADLIARQIGMLVHLMQVAATAAARKAAAASSSNEPSSAADIQIRGDTEPRSQGKGSSASELSSSEVPAGGAQLTGVVRRSSLGGVNAAAVLRQYSSSWAHSSRAQLAPDVLEAARQLLCIQTGGNGWFLVSRLKELVANPPAAYADADGSRTFGAARPSSTRGSTGVVAPAETGTKKGSDAVASTSSKTPTAQGKNMLAKSGKILGVHLSGSSSSTKSSGLAGLKVGHSVESFANAASAMASVISRNASATKQKQANSTNTNSPTNSTNSTVSSSAPPSTCGSTVPSSGAAAFQHSTSCNFREPAAANAMLSEGGASSAAAGLVPDGAGGQAAAGPTSSCVGAVAETSHHAASGSSGSRRTSRSTGGKPAQHPQQDAQGIAECCVPPDVFEVLSDMLNSVVEVAAAQDDSRVVLTVLELSCLITCTTGDTKLYLLSKLAGNPAMHTEWFWASTFGFAVSSSYLNADEFVNVRAVITRCLQQFARYLAGVGIPGAAAFVLLMQVAADHLQLAHMEPLEPDTQLSIRRQLAQAQHEFAMSPAQVATALQDTGSGSTASSSQGHAGSTQQQQQTQQPLQPEQKASLPLHLAAALRACGITLPNTQLNAPEHANCSTYSSGSSSSTDWHVDAPADAHAATGTGCTPALTIAAPGAVETEVNSSAATGGPLGDHPDTEAPAPAQRPPTPLSPVSAASTPSVTAAVRVGAGSPKAVAVRAVKEHGSYAKLLSRQAGNSPGNSPTAAAALATATGMEGGSLLGSVGGAPDADVGADVPTPLAPALAVQGDCLVDQGALQWAAVHQGAVVAVAASSYTAVTAGLDGCMKVLHLSGGTMRLTASMQIPSLQDVSAVEVGHAGTLPVLQLWHDGQRAAVGNARRQAVWIVDLTGGKPSLELSGLGSGVSCLFPLYRNRDALLSGLAHGGVACMRSNVASSSTQLAAAYLWDLRRPKKPASSLNFTAEPPAATRPTPAADSVLSSSATSSMAVDTPAAEAVDGVPGILCLSVHEDGALAAAGFKDGRVLTWDMRQPSTPLSECQGHTGPVHHVSFLPSAASAAAGLGRVPLLLTGSEDWTACLWDAETGTCRGACVGHGGAVTAMQTVHSNSSTRFVTGAADGSIGVWGLDCEMVSLVQQYEKPVMLLRQGGDTLVSGAADKACHVVSLQHLLPGGSSSSNGYSAAGQLSHLLASQRKPASVGAMAFDPVAEMLCAGHKDGIVSVWNCCYSTQCSAILE